MNETATALLVIPLVVLAARVLGPGHTRLRLVKLAHQLKPRGVVLEPEGGFVDRPAPAARAAKRAA